MAANDIMLGKLMVNTSQLESDLKKVKSNIDGVVSHLKQSGKGELAQGLQSSMEDVSKSISEVQVRLRDMERAAKSIDLGTISDKLNDLNQTVLKISTQLENTLGGALAEINKDGTKLDFSGVIKQLRTLSNAFITSANAATEQKEALEQTGDYTGDRFGLKGLKGNLEGLIRALSGKEGLISLIDGIEPALNKLSKIDFGSKTADMRDQLESLDEVYSKIKEIREK